MPKMKRGGPRGPMMPFMMTNRGPMGGGMKPWMFFLMPVMFLFFMIMMATRGNPLMIVGFVVCLVMMVIGGGFMMMMQGENEVEKPKHDDTDGIVTGTDGKRYIRTGDGTFTEIAE